MNRTRWPIPFKLALFALLVMLTTACNSGSSGSPTFPAALTLQSDSTATQIEPAGFRIQLRMTVLEGRDELQQAARSGAARAQTCLDGMCVEGPLTTHFAEASCAGAFQSRGGRAEIGFGTAWVEGGSLGVDFCVSDPGEEITFQTSVSTGGARSNVVTTSCSLNGGGLFCGSG